MQSLLRGNDNPNLRVYVVFVPMLGDDGVEAASERSNELSDARLSYFWDPTVLTGRAYQDVLGIDRPAWDVYFLYGKGATWESEPGPAAHSMTGHSAIAGKAAKFELGEAEAKVKELLKGGR